MGESAINTDDISFDTYELLNYGTILFYYNLPQAYLDKFCISTTGQAVGAKLRIEYPRDKNAVPEYAVVEIAAVVKDVHGRITLDITNHRRWHLVSLDVSDIETLLDMARNEI